MKVFNSGNCISKALTFSSGFSPVELLSKVQSFMVKNGKSLIEGSGALISASSLKKLSISILSRNTAMLLGAGGIFLAISLLAFKWIKSEKFSDLSFFKNFSKNNCRLSDKEKTSNDKLDIAEVVSQKIAQDVLKTAESKKDDFNTVNSLKDPTYESDLFLQLADFKF